MSKRSNHEGSIGKKIIKGKTYYRVQLTIEGKKIEKYAKTRKDAAAILDDLRLEFREHGRLIKEDFTLEKLASMWIDSKKAGWSTKTVEGYWTPMNNHILPELSKKKISFINNPIFLDDFFNQTLMKQGKTAHMVSRCHRSLRNCFEWAVGRNLISTNKCNGGKQGYFPLPKHEQKSKPELSPVEIAQLKEAIANSSQSTLFTLLIASGMRISEALGLSESDLDMSSNRITIRHQLKYENGIFYLDKTKSRKTRIIQVGQSIMDILIIKLADNESLRCSLADRSIEWNPNVSCNCCSNSSFQLLFLSQAGTPLDYTNIQARAWKQMIKSSGMDVKLTPHNLRDIYASTALVKGYDVVTVSKHLGHADPSITLKVYAQFIKSPNQIEMAEELAEIFTR